MFNKLTKEEIKSVQWMFDKVEHNMKESDFQREFYESLSAQWQLNERLSAKQIEALRKIYERLTG